MRRRRRAATRTTRATQKLEALARGLAQMLVKAGLKPGKNVLSIRYKSTVIKADIRNAGTVCAFFKAARILLCLVSLSLRCAR